MIIALAVIDGIVSGFLWALLELVLLGVGAVLAGAFDQVFNVANLSSGTAGPTRELSLRYRRPTPLQRPLVFEAWIEETTERNVTTVGHVMHEGEVTVETRGTFALIAHERIVRMGPDDS